MILNPGPPVFDPVWLEIPVWEVPAAFVVEVVLVAGAPAEPVVAVAVVLVVVAPVEPAVAAEVVLV
jgi:hypothetical protein